MSNMRTNRPGMAVTLLASAARTTSSNSGSLKDTTTPWPMAQDITVFLSVTAFAAGYATAATFDVAIDTSPDNGTTWVLAAAASRITSSTAIRSLQFNKGMYVGEATEENPNFPRLLNTTTNRPGNLIPLTRDVRVRWEISGAQGANTPSVTFAVWAFTDPD